MVKINYMENKLLEDYNNYIADVMRSEESRIDSTQNDPLNFVNFVLLPTFEEWKEMILGRVA